MSPPRPPTTTASPTWQRALAAGALLLLTVLAYGPALRAGFIWDDDALVTENLLLRTWSGLVSIWLRPGSTFQYYPLTFTSWWAQYQLWTLAPAGYHAVNVLLHGGSAVLLWLVLCRLGVPGAWMAAAVFALHPVHVESVAWVSELKNVQSGVFYLLATVSFLYWALGDAARPRRWLYPLSLLLFACALLSKTVTCTLPVALALMVWWKRGRVPRDTLVALVPFVVIGIAAAAVTPWMERHYVGAAGQDWELSFAERGLVAGRALWFYAAKLVWPSRLTFIYPRWTLDPHSVWQWLFPLAAAGTLVALFRSHHRLGRGPLIAALYFVMTLGPALGFIDVYPMRYSFVADHFQYLASLGPITLLVAWATTLLGERRRTRHALSGLVLAALAALVWRQAAAYRDAETLWRDTIAKNPSAMIAHNNLGVALLVQAKHREARNELEEAIRLAQGRSVWEPRNNLGRLLLLEGEPGEAARQFEEASRLADDRIYPEPSAAVIHNNLGLAYLKLDRAAEAAAEFERAAQLRPDYADALYNLGNVRALEGRIAEAEAAYHRVLALDERYALAHNSLGNVLAMQGRRDEAVAHYRRALEIDPGYADARANLDVVRGR